MLGKPDPYEKVTEINRRSQRGGSQYVWALNDLNFEIKQGEAFGIVGPNGAGKSTLLKILSRITAPTEGRVMMNGRISSLLEIGTGFHPELTGRENIYLNGAIMGMTRHEISGRIEQIAEFSGCERYLDTPVKRYSSGMTVRLGFAVAAHLNSEVLIIDEVLAVGDAEFQRRCLSKMGEVTSNGRTILFVSHNMIAVNNLCSKGMLLNNGKGEFVGPIRKAIMLYHDTNRLFANDQLATRTDRKGSQLLRFTKVEILNSLGKRVQEITSGDSVRIRIDYSSKQLIHRASVIIAFNVINQYGYSLTNLNCRDSGNFIVDIYKTGFFACDWPNFCLRSGAYTCNLFCSINGDVADWVQSAFVLNVTDGDFFDTGRLINREAGDILIPHSWSAGRRTDD